MVLAGGLGCEGVGAAGGWPGEWEEGGGPGGWLCESGCVVMSGVASLVGR